MAPLNSKGSANEESSRSETVNTDDKAWETVESDTEDAGTDDEEVDNEDSTTPSVSTQTATTTTVARTPLVLQPLLMNDPSLGFPPGYDVPRPVEAQIGAIADFTTQNRRPPYVLASDPVPAALTDPNLMAKHREKSHCRNTMSMIIHDRTRNANREDAFEDYSNNWAGTPNFPAYKSFESFSDVHTLHKVGMANLILRQYDLGRSRNYSVCLALWNAFLATHQLPPVQAVGDGYTPTAPAPGTVRNPVPTQQATQLILTAPVIVQNPIQIQQPTDDRWAATTNADSNEREAEDDVEHDEVEVDEEDDGKKGDKDNGKGTKRKREDDEDHDFLENGKRGPPGGAGSRGGNGTAPTASMAEISAH